MRAAAFAYFLYLASENAEAFVPTTSSVISPFSSSAVTYVRPSSYLELSSSGFLGMDDDEDEDDEDEDDDEDDDVRLSSYTGAKSPFTGLKMDPFDPNPLIKPRPSRLFREEEKTIPDDQLVQTMSADERGENVNVMRQIRKNDLPDLRRRKDHAGWVEANNDLKRRLAKDPWFGVNDRLRDAIQLGADQEKIDYLKDLAKKLGGPPPGIDAEAVEKRGYAVHTEIYKIGLSPNRSMSLLDRQIREDRVARGRAMMAERRKNLEQQQRQYEEDMRNPGVREDREAKARRERTMRRLMDELEEDNKKKQERAREILGKLPETPESRVKAMEKALQEARDEVKKIRRQQLGKSLSSRSEEDEDDDDDDDEEDKRPKTGADRAREVAASEASGGRPRLPGDTDVTRGELTVPVESSSKTTTGPLSVEVTSSYNHEQSDPPMRKHCFQYTIRITNNSPTDTIQLLGRRFEIQTVGSSMKDVVQGEGVTGRTPILAPGEVFEYTSTAPLSVRPLGTTIIAARMRGEYRYVTLAPGQTTASEEQLKSKGEATAELGTFHFIFPQDQRVQPFRAEDEEEDDEDDDDDDYSEPPKAAAKSPPASPSTAATPSSTLPGDEDMKTGLIKVKLNDSSEEVTDNVRVEVTTSYRPERSDDRQDKHCFAYNIRITNQNSRSIQLVSRRFEIQTVGSPHKDVVQGPGVTGRQPTLKPGESFEYTSTAPLSVKPMLDLTPVVARMQGEYNFVLLSDDGTTPMSSNPLKAKLAMFHFILPAMT
ncbi:hypothetical protein FisN_22Lh106 [Fistulifera solaris]|uniref:ApaG domain-containing protein n=1 Tax=Fistulifera solaris TaxID=1519565 RepID=A0A1Z5JCD5_FISSO|nr:hypothetical protein FisN_22Lh106 [Fistulifera solaris]|eukprot:GAX11421.1 hypothetical protein FisN_22Lh106 [Fistulifera solaris]